MAVFKSLSLVFGAISNIESQFMQQSRKASFNILMHVLPGTARDLPSFISQLKEWGFAMAEPKEWGFTMAEP